MFVCKDAGENKYALMWQYSYTGKVFYNDPKNFHTLLNLESLDELFVILKQFNPFIYQFQLCFEGKQIADSAVEYIEYMRKFING